MHIDNIKIIVVGSTGLVGREMLKILSEINVPCQNVYASASARSKGKRIDYGNTKIVVQDLAEIDFHNYDVALFSAGSAVSKIYVPKAIDAGCYVIDNTSYFRMKDDVPLIIPEVNTDAIGNAKLIANPNCSTIQAVLPLKPLYDLFELTDVIYSTYQSAGGAGQAGIDELTTQTNAICRDGTVPQPQKFEKQLAFNIIPKIGHLCVTDCTLEEEKMIHETKKILSAPYLSISATCVRVPVMVGHAVSVTAFFKRSFSCLDAINAISHYPGVKYVSSQTITPLDIVGKNDVYISRIRQVDGRTDALSFWCVADNIRKGAALNAVQILQRLCNPL